MLNQSEDTLRTEILRATSQSIERDLPLEDLRGVRILMRSLPAHPHDGFRYPMR